MKTPILKIINFKTLLLIGLILAFSCSDDDCNCETPPVDETVLSLCENGFAGIYPCDGYDLIAHIPANELGGPGAQGNDSWGWTDPQTGVEYAIIGTTTGTAFVDISKPLNPVIVGTLPTINPNDPNKGYKWRDIKVFEDHAYIVSEAAGHGMQVFNLTRLRNVANAPETFTTDTHFTEFGRAHNITINEDSGYAYVVGIRSPNRSLFINIQNPLNPIISGELNSYNHDAQVVTYNGPDTDYSGKEIFIGSNESEVLIADITDKLNPVIISTIAYQNIGYTHQGWFTEDLKYFIVGDELDEINFGGKTRTLVFDFTDLDNPALHHTYFGPTDAIDHNGYVKGNTFYMANYTAGVRFIDISDVENKNMHEVGFFDTYPNNDNTAFKGVWNVYPYFESGNILISDIEGGLFIVRKSKL